MTTPIDIRPATAADAAAIAAIYNHYIDHTIVTFETRGISPDEMATRISDGLANYPWHVATIGGKLAGYAYASQWNPRHGYRKTVETTIYLAPDHAGQGIGSVLYPELLDTLKRSGFHCALGGIALPNVASVALHEKLGFRKVGELAQVGWKFDRWIDVGYWQLHF